jgi:chromate transport protein ChrA
VLCIVWLAGFNGGFVSILLVVMPIIILVMTLGSASKQYEASRR